MDQGDHAQAESTTEKWNDPIFTICDVMPSLDEEDDIDKVQKCVFRRFTN